MNAPKGFSFRKSVRGFNKDDVIKYISEENNRFMQEKTALEEKITEAEWQAAEMYRKLEEQKDHYENLLKTKDAETAAAKDETEKAKAEAEKAKAELSEVQAKESAVSAENERLKALLAGCEEQLKQYADKLAQLETVVASKVYEKEEYERLKGENEYIRGKYKTLEAEFCSLSEKLRVIESTPVSASSPRESREDPFQRPAGIRVQSQGHSGIPSKSVREQGSKAYSAPTSGIGYTSKDSGEISDKAIKTILAVNDTVKGYMSDCVGEFDSYSHDIAESLTKLAEEISERCKALDRKIKAHKDAVSGNIDDIYGGFNSGN